MSDDLGKQNAKDKSDDAACKSEGNKTPKLSRTIWHIIFTTLAGLFGTLGALFISIHRTPLKTAFGCFFVGIVFGALATRLHLINHKYRHTMPHWLPDAFCAGIILLGFIGCFVGCILASPSEIRNLVVTIRSTESPKSAEGVTTLTYACLKERSTAGWQKPRSIIFVPVKTGTLNAGISIDVQNASSGVAEDIEASVSMTRECRVRFSNGWESTTINGGISYLWGNGNTNAMLSMTYRVPFTLLSGNSMTLPGIGFPNPATDELPHFSPITMGIMVRAKDFADDVLWFYIGFVTNSPLSKPLVVCPEDNNGNLKVDLTKMKEFTNQIRTPPNPPYD